MAESARIQELFQRWQEARRQGKSVSVEELCQDCPDLTAALRQQIEQGQSTDQGAGGTVVQTVAPGAGAPASVPVSGSMRFLELEAGSEPVPGYRLVARLGRGAFGQVWKAVGPGGFSVAMKFVRMDEMGERIELRSLEVMKDVRHANLLAMFGAWKQADMLIVAMELGERTLLERLVQVRKEGLPGIPWDELISYMDDAARGIDYLNEPRHALDGSKSALSIQHRDIKPQNLLLQGGCVKVADFGLAKFLEQTAATNSGSMTASYAAPECFKGKTSNRSDQYSLAVTYCQLRGGSLPFTGSNVNQLMIAHVGRPPDLSMLPAEERPVLGRALAKEPEQRWPSCRAFVRALEEAHARPAEQPGREGVSLALGVDSLPTVVPSAPPASSWQGKTAGRKQRRVFVGLLAGAVAIAAGLATGIALNLQIGEAGIRATVTKVLAQAPTTPGETTLATVATRTTPDTRRTTLETKKTIPEKSHEEIRKAKAAARIADGVAAMKNDRMKEAIDCFDDAEKLDPENVALYVFRAEAYQEQGKHRPAIKDFDQAIDRGRRNADTLTARGRSKASSTIKDYKGAIEDFTQALKLDKQHFDAHRFRAVAHLEDSQPDAALGDALEAIAINPKHAPTYHTLGRIHLQLKQVDKAIAAFGRAIDNDIDYARAYLSRARGQVQKGNDKDAVRDFGQVIRVNKDLVLEAYEERAAAYGRLGMKAEMRADLEMVKKLKAMK